MKLYSKKRFFELVWFSRMSQFCGCSKMHVIRRKNAKKLLFNIFKTFLLKHLKILTASKTFTLEVNNDSRSGGVIRKQGWSTKNRRRVSKAKLYFGSLSYTPYHQLLHTTALQRWTDWTLEGAMWREWKWRNNERTKKRGNRRVCMQLWGMVCKQNIKY